MIPGPAGALTSAEPRSPLEAILLEALLKLGGIACSAEDQRQLLSTVLHAIAEAVRGPEAHDDTLKQYTGALEGMHRKLVQHLRSDQIKLLRRIADPAGLRRELG